MKRQGLAAILTLTLAFAAGSAEVRAQSQNGLGIPAPPPPAAPASPPSDSHGSDDTTLEVAPRIIPIEPPPADNNPGDNGASGQSSSGQSSQGSDDVANLPALRTHKLPYLGITVRPALVRFQKQDVHGLEIIGIDAGSPAEHAGLHTPTDMTTIGATSETAGFMLGPLGNLISPLLAHTGQLGEGGDMLVAVDEQRVSNPDELYQALERLQPGDTVWLTVMRITRSGAPKTERIPVVLASAGG
jgi:hypothetical protein